MELKSISDCLTFSEDMILCDIQKIAGVSDLEAVRDFMIGMFINKYIEEMIAMLGVLKQTNIIIEKAYEDDESDLKKVFWILRKHILAWLQEKITKPETDNDE